MTSHAPKTPPRHTPPLTTQSSRTLLRFWHKFQLQFARFFKHTPHTEQQLLSVLVTAHSAHLLTSSSLRMMKGVLNIANRHVRDIMIPRSQMIVIQNNLQLSSILPMMIESGHSRFPVVGTSSGQAHEKIVGILLAKDLLRYTQQNPHSTVVDRLMRPAIFIPEGMRLHVLLDEFRLKHNHLAIVLDEYGNCSGMITIEDVLEEIVGDIEDEYDTENSTPDIKPLNKTQYTVKGLTSIQDVNTYFKTALSNEQFDTIGGIVTHAFGHVPKRGESLMLGNLRCKVLQSDLRRVRLLRITPHQPHHDAMHAPESLHHPE